MTWYFQCLLPQIASLKLCHRIREYQMVGVNPVKERLAVVQNLYESESKMVQFCKHTCSSKFVSILCFHVETRAANSVCFSDSAMLARRASYIQENGLQSIICSGNNQTKMVTLGRIKFQLMKRHAFHCLQNPNRQHIVFMLVLNDINKT